MVVLRGGTHIDKDKEERSAHVGTFIYLFDNFYLIKLHETCRASHNNSVNKRIVKGYTLQIMQKICTNQKGFGQGMGATNAQNQVKQI